MADIIFSPEALDQYIGWQTTDKKMVLKINALIKDIRRNGLMAGIGKPEPLRGRKGYSRHINYEHRLVYDGDENRNLRIISCNGHYED
jgi:toxin YoeB